MASLVRLQRLCFASLALLTTFLAGCPTPPGSTICPTTGIVCPEDMICAAAQAVCLTDNCGNGADDGVTEDCDDGNIIDGDGCSSDCEVEECGNNFADPGEECDGPSGARPPEVPATAMCGPASAGVSACKWMYCSNGLTDPGETCDDGDLENGDGCTGTPVEIDDGMGGVRRSPEACMSREVCGNNIVDFHVGEVCDDGNMTSGDGCNSDCRSGEGCGNGILDPGEQCDDGDSDNNDTCRNDCIINVCGDGIIDTTDEDCDAGNTTSPAPVETTACNIDCTDRVCGDAKVNQTSGEQCDNGVGQNGDTRNCTAGCLLNICGDGRVDMQTPGIEACDDGNPNNFDGCSNSCQLASCGNMTVDTGETCDDGNMDNADACVACQTAVCGDGFTRTGVEQCDDMNLANGDGCSSTCRVEGCGNGNLDPGEECDDGNMINTDACVTGCDIAICGDNFIRMTVEVCDDGNVMDGDGCSSICQSEGCGNGVLDPGEQCDDNDTMGGDGCSATCQLEDCGDGFVDVGEQCDGNGTGTGGETASCNIDCTTRVCGDAKVNATGGEQCDAGAGMNANDRDCTMACRINICTDGHLNSLGPNNLEACDDGNMNNNDACSNNCVGAMCGNGSLNPGEQCDDDNSVQTDSCLNNCMNASCGDGFVEVGVDECDGGIGCSSACKFQVCGNGIIDPNENCDDGNILNGDGCTGNPAPAGLQRCRSEFCGDGFDNNGTAEACDGNNMGANGGTNVSGCDSNCTAPACGDSHVNPNFNPGGGTEQCDPPSAMNGCSAMCRFERCGNGVLDPQEECEIGVAGETAATCYASTDPRGCLEIECGNNRIDTGEQCEPPSTRGCNAMCQTILYCGDGVISASLSETCDPPNTQTCDHNCTATACGDGTVNPLASPAEVCDGGSGSPVFTSTCDNDCTAAACGDSVVNMMAGEMCDDGATGTLPNNGFTSNCLPYCQPNVCGDGFVDGVMPTVEMCDFGSGNDNTTLCLGCTNPTMLSTCPYNTTCQTCNDCGATGTTNGGTCDDDMIQGPEQCDDSATISTTCASLGFGFTGGTLGCMNTTMAGMCFFNMTNCTVCGDGVEEGSETCDDNNTTAGDGCSATCTVEANYTCNGTMPSICQDCGNNKVEGTEACDDGDAGGDGCTAACVVEANWSCLSQLGHPSVCNPICGDGMIVGPEVCDGVNLASEMCSTLSAGQGGPFFGGNLACAPNCLQFNVGGCNDCGDGTCGTGESDMNCHIDCHCGNGVCESAIPYSENMANCAADCP